MTTLRIVLATAVVTAGASLGACGSDSGAERAAVSTQAGSVANPLEARPQPHGIPSRAAGRSPGTAQADPAAVSANEGSAGDEAKTPASSPVGYQKLVEQQGRKPESRFTPCSLVSRAQARAIVGAAVSTPLEAPQGPTCIYRTTDSRGFVTVAVERGSYASVARRLQHVRRLRIEGRPAACGTYGRPRLAVSLSGGRILNVAAPCGIAQRFAAQAVQRLQD